MSHANAIVSRSSEQPRTRSSSKLPRGGTHNSKRGRVALGDTLLCYRGTVSTQAPVIEFPVYFQLSVRFKRVSYLSCHVSCLYSVIPLSPSLSFFLFLGHIFMRADGPLFRGGSIFQSLGGSRGPLTSLTVKCATDKPRDKLFSRMSRNTMIICPDL